MAGHTVGREGGLPLAALQAIAVAAGVGQAAVARTPTTRPEAGKPKVARTLEVKTEIRTPDPQLMVPAAPQNISSYVNGYGNSSRGRGGYGGRGRDGYGNGGRGWLARQR